MRRRLRRVALKPPSGVHAVVSRLKAGEDTVPALLVALGVVWRHAIVGQGQFTSLTFGLDLDGDGGRSRIELRHAEGKDQPPRPIDLQVFADMADVTHVRAPLGKRKAAANARLDLGHDHLSCGCGEQKATCDLHVQKGVEDSLRRSSIVVGDHHAGCGLCRHGLSSIRTLSSSPSRHAQSARCSCVHFARASSGSGLSASRCSRPRLRRRTKSARSRSRMCLETEFSEIGKGAAISVTRASPAATRARIARRVGSARAISVWSRALYSPIWVNNNAYPSRVQAAEFNVAPYAGATAVRRSCGNELVLESQRNQCYPVAEPRRSRREPAPRKVCLIRRPDRTGVPDLVESGAGSAAGLVPATPTF